MSGFGVVVLAVDDYPDPPGPLPSSESAERFARLLGGEHGGILLASVVVRREPDLLDAIRDWAADAARPTSSVVYLVGHGRGQGLAHEFLVPRDGEVVGLRTAGLAQHLERDWLRRQTDPASWALLVLDCCDSALGVDNLVAQLAMSPPTKPRRLGLWPVAPGGAARTGAFVDAFEHALETFTENDERVPLDEVFRRIRHVLGDLQPEGFLPDEAALSRPKPAAPVVLPLDVHAELRRAIAGQPPELRSHFLTKAQGGEAGEVAWHFSGRGQELDELCDWLDGGAGLKVVTGEAGSGKSALLGHLVVASNPELVSLYERSGLALGMAAGPRPPDHVFDAVVHLTGKTVHEAIDELGAQLGLDLPDDDHSRIDGGLRSRMVAFADRVRGAGRTGATVLVDALDEAQDPHAVAAFLHDVAGGPLRVLVGTRRSLSEGPDQPADPSHRELLDALGVDETGLLTVERDREAVYAYAKQRLVRDGSPYRGRPDVVTKVARQIAKRDQPFLFARLATAELLARPALDPAGPELGELLRHGHRGIFAAALERIAATDPAASAMVRALAYKRGRGMPRSGGIWALAARAVAEAAGPADGWEEAAIALAGPYITLDAEAGQSTYRLAHQTFVEHFYAQEGYGAGHRRIAAALAEGHRGERWLAANYYAVRYLAEHLVADAERTAPDAGGLRALATDAGWLVRAVGLLGVDRTIEVLAAARQLAGPGPDRAEDEPGDVEFVERALRRSRVALGRDPAQLPAQLHARLKDLRPAVAGLGAAAGDIVGRPWLRMVENRLDWRYDLETTNTLVGKVRGLGFGDLDGRPVVAIAVDRRVVLWDPRTGVPDEAGTIDLGDHRATAVAVATIDEQPVVVTSAAYDGAVEVWDARTGARLAATAAGLGHSLAVGQMAGRLVIAGVDGSHGPQALDARTLDPVEPVEELRRRDVQAFAVRRGALVALCLDWRAVDDAQPPTRRMAITVLDTTTGDELWRTMDLDERYGRIDVAAGGDLGSAFLVVAGVGRFVYWLTEGAASGHVATQPDNIRLRAAAVGPVAGRPVVASAPDYDGTALILLQQAARQAIPGRPPFYAPRAPMKLRRPAVAFDAPAVPVELGGWARGSRPERYAVERPQEWPHTAAAAAELDGRPALVTGSLEGAVWVWDVAGGHPRAVAGPFGDVPAHVLEFGWRAFGMKPGVPSATSIAFWHHSALGPMVAVACGGRVRMYTVPAGRPVENAADHASWIDVVDLGRLGGREVLITGSKGGVVGVWQLSPPERTAVLTMDRPVTDVRADTAGEVLWVRTAGEDIFGLELAEP